MKLLFTGRGTSGSWKVRGEQLGKACGATVKPMASLQQCRDADIIVQVKRFDAKLLGNLQKSGRPWVWDLVDFYPQPACSVWSRAKAIKWVQRQIKAAKPSGVIWPNRRMQADCSVNIPGLVLYHHARPDVGVNMIAPTIKNVGYEGSPRYLGRWQQLIIDQCSARGWKFCVNTHPVDKVDLVVAFRDDPHNGYVQRHWKSNVKLSNAHGAGTPFIGPSESGYIETGTGFESWVNDMSALSKAFDRLEPYKVRAEIGRQFLANAYTLDEAARDLTEFLEIFA